MIADLGAASEHAEHGVLHLCHMLPLDTMLYWFGWHVHALMFAVEDSQISSESDSEPPVYNPRFVPAVTNCISVGHRHEAETDFETVTGCEFVQD